MNEAPIVPELPSAQRALTIPFIAPVRLDPDRHFQTDHLKADLGNRSARSTAYTGGAQAVGLLLRMGATVVLARLLTPADYGLFGMVTVVVAFISLFNDFGLSMATIQKEKMTHAEASTLFWVNVGVSSLLSGLLIVLSPVVVWFYHEPKLFWLNIVLAPSLVVGGLRVQHGAILRRQMRFGVIALVDLTALIFGIACGIAIAWARHDYWGLAAMHWGSCLTACIGTWLVCGWCPGLPGKLAAVRSHLHFGTRLTGSQLLQFLMGNLDNILIGRFWGTIALGLYARAYQLLLLPVQQISVPLMTVATPTLSRLQAEPGQFRHYYCRAVNLMAFAILPMIAVLAALAHEAVFLLLGPSWSLAATIFQALALAGAIEPFMSSAQWIMIATGRTDRLFYWSLLSSSVIVLSFIIGIPWGGVGVAIAYAGARCLLIVPSMWFALRGTQIGLPDVGRAVWRPLCLSILLFATVLSVRCYVLDRSPGTIAFLSIMAGLAVSFTAILLWPQARAEAIGLLNVMRQMLGRSPKVALGSVED
jgi:O-antigen/teichoic acid export membrane protein